MVNGKGITLLVFVRVLVSIESIAGQATLSPFNTGKELVDLLARVTRTRGSTQFAQWVELGPSAGRDQMGQTTRAEFFQGITASEG